jgi:hypothetical protein
MILRIFPKFSFAFLLIGFFAGVFLIPRQTSSSSKSFAQIEKSLVTLRLSPSSGRFSVGKEAILSILLENIQGRVVDGVDIKLRFDPKKILVTEIIPNQEDFMAFPVEKVDSEKGTVFISALSFWDKPLLGGERPVEIAKLRLLPLTLGEASLSFDFSPGLTTDINVAEHQTNFDILEEVEGGRYELSE